MLTVFRFSILVAVLSFISILLDPRIHEPAGDLNTTVVILNWSRPFNVNKIVSEICKNLFDDVVHSVIIWNNNPKPMSFENNFANASCPKSRVQIINSPDNLYFQARYMACAQATTPFCFIQDDDYLILPEIVRAFVRRIGDNSASTSSIHLQPPHEMLSSELRTVVINETLHTTFAWLGYGTIVKRSRVVEFISLLDHLNLLDEQHKMADNYFTILSNEIPERWFDAGIELGGGQAFTVGTEGEERNNRHIIEAAKILESIISAGDVASTSLPYVKVQPNSPLLPTISRAPCHGRLCVFETSIKLIPDEVYDISVSSISDMLVLEKERLKALGEQNATEYLNFAPSNAVDGIRDTVFRSAENGKHGEYVILDLTECHFYDRLQWVLEVGAHMGAILDRSVYESSEDGVNWHAWGKRADCSNALDDGLRTSRVMSCVISAEKIRVRYFRMRLLEDVEYKWEFHEVYLSPIQE
ncbi:hypothetical protein BDN70DRAFT_870164 [Pholiota conissans]|uniref:F5/8 type C domain-containing protein n=1 Tax=Pholiota conissans TaxID=109636 RepID=A0A9P5ZIN2_9AGAR|nr:hypothetical protein BDN70DRAFT_870164 [Pholiota conissans]